MAPLSRSPWCAGRNLPLSPNSALSPQTATRFPPIVGALRSTKWWIRWDSNPLPLLCHSSALPAELLTLGCGPSSRNSLPWIMSPQRHPRLHRTRNFELCGEDGNRTHRTVRARDSSAPAASPKLVIQEGFEPSTSCLSSRRYYQLSYRILLVLCGGVEPPLPAYKDRVRTLGQRAKTWSSRKELNLRALTYQARPQNR
jgi:hypothetical protein